MPGRSSTRCGYKGGGQRGTRGRGRGRVVAARGHEHSGKGRGGVVHLGLEVGVHVRVGVLVEEWVQVPMISSLIASVRY